MFCLCALFITSGLLLYMLCVALNCLCCVSVLFVLSSGVVHGLVLECFVSVLIVGRC